MKQSDADERGKAASAGSAASDDPSRTQFNRARGGPEERRTDSRIAALLAAGLLLVVGAGRWDKLAYPHYLGEIAFQCAVLMLLVLWAFPRKRANAECSMRNAEYRQPTLIFRTDFWLIAPYIAYGLYTILSCSWAFNSRLALVGGAVQVTFPLVWAVGLGMLLRSREEVRTVLRAVFVAGVIAGYAGVYYVIRDGTLEAVQNVQGQRNFLATFLLPPITIGLAELFWGFLAGVETSWRPLQWPKYLVLLGMLAMAASLVFVFFRSVGALMGLLAAVVCLLAIRLSRRQRLVIVGIILLLAIAALTVLSARPPPVTAWMMQHSSVATRWFMWQGAVRMILARPLFGWGPGNFILAFSDYKPTEPMRYGWLGNFTIYPHNELLLVGAEGGLLALALYLAGHVLVASGVIRFGGGSRKPEIRLVGWTLLAAALGMFVHAQVDVMLRFWAPSVMFWTLIGLMIAEGRMHSASRSARDEAGGGNAEYRREPSSFPRPARGGTFRICLFWAVLLLVVVLAVGVVWSGARAEWLLGGGGLGKNASLQEVVRDRAEAVRLSRYVPDYLLALKERGDGLWQEGDLGAAIASYEELDHTAPGYGQTRQMLGELYFLRAREIGSRNEEAARADLAKSVEWLERAVTQYPYHSAPRLLLARVMFRASRKNLPAAIEQGRTAVEVDPNSAQAHILLAALLVEAGQKQEALEELDRAAALCEPSSELGRSIEAVKKAIEGQPTPRP